MVVLAGVTGFITLFATLACGVALGVRVAASHPHPAELVLHSCATLVVSLAFFLWALYKTLTTPTFDGGCISMALAFLVAAYGLGATRVCIDFNVRTYKALACCGYGAPALNYAIALAMTQFALGAVFFYYLVAGLIFWTLCILTAFCITLPFQEEPGYHEIPGLDDAEFSSQY